ncbi:hypothetical protein BKA70DRAFT_1575985 [Coprinopsis sp. MPI-PUGE-AT-0042]|nr:hypothetical protein BKA70DRAFT_1575985 [Coprinopsis sp. MPI-PUGE-AT-0042]
MDLVGGIVQLDVPFDLTTPFQSTSPTLSLDSLALSNEPLNPAQSQFVHAQIAMVNASISRLDVEMQVTARRLQTLRAQRGELSKSRQAYISLFSPWRSLPTEILAEILRFTLDPGCGHRGGLSATAQLTTLAQVCKRWANVVYETPSLWCEVEVDERTKEVDAHALVANLKKHYSRSGPMPWTISFSSERLAQRNHSHPTIPPSPSPLVLFLKESSKWKSIRFTHQHLDLLAPLFTLHPGQAHYSWPELESLHLKGWYYGPAKAEPFTNPNRPLYVGSMPRLRSLTLHTFDQQIANWKLPWGQLTFLHLATADTCLQYLKILNSCPNLERCIISIPPTVDSTTSPPSHRQDVPKGSILLPNLHTLELSYASIAWPFFSAVTLPALTTLSVSSPPPDGRQMDMLLGETLSELIARSKCSLRSLTLKNIPLQDSDYVDILEQTRELALLHIVDWIGSSPLWLNHVNERNTIPRLREMSMQGFMEQESLLREFLFEFLVRRGGVGFDDQGPFYVDEVRFSEHSFHWIMTT